MLFTTTYIAVLGLSSYASAHMALAKPTRFAADTNNSPLDGHGADFPCKLKFDTTTPATQMALGSTQPLEFTGQATHGGGSCQVSITYDNPPNKNSVFKVIHSIEGGCPTRNAVGNLGDSASTPDPDTYSFTIPTSLPTGKAVLAWTWFNHVGNREMYMNCAPISITGASAKRSGEEELIVRNITQLMERDQNAFNSLPDMFVANIGLNDCATPDNKDIEFPNPGSSVEKLKATLVKPVGSGCGASVGSSSGSGSSGSSGASASSTAAAPATATATGNSPGVFATVASGSTASPAIASPAKASSTPAAAPASSSSSSASGSSGSSTGASGAQAAGSACSPEGQWNCIGGTSFQQCASGTWSVVQALAAGTKCAPGQSASINITAAKRAIRFSSEHVRRHLHRSQ